MKKREISKRDYRGFQIQEIEITSDTDSGESMQIQWIVSRIEGEMSNPHNRQHKIGGSLAEAERWIDGFLKTAASPKP
jgi:hypothetical protein